VNRKGNVLVVVLIIIAVLALVGAAYFYLQNQKLKTTVSYISPAPSGLQVNPSPTPLVANPKATVAFEAEGSFSQGEKDELYAKVINPYLDYNQDQNSTLVSLTISKNDKSNKDTYPYLALGIFKNGGTEGFVIVQKGTGIDWWYPTCMGPCPFSDSFKAKYPEISSNPQ